MLSEPYKELRKYVQRQIDKELFFLTPQRRTSTLRVITKEIKRILEIKQLQMLEADKLEQAKDIAAETIERLRDKYYERGVK